jgi:zinc D-Ala-D-Ala carboxypeptidase|tara:strand:- start:118 stop:504 length:387 start_codon:yes stop_codon:yes gene_type:complete
MSINSQFFTRKELACKGTEECEMNDEFMSKLEQLRIKFNEPMIITSGYRHPAHNMVVGGDRFSAHIQGRAVDVLVMGRPALRLVRLALECGMTGIGVAQRGPDSKRFIHIDDLENSQENPRPWIWSYK